MGPSHPQLKLTDAPFDPMVPAASAGGPRSNDGTASSGRPAQVTSAIRRPDGHRDQMTRSERDARFASVVLPYLADAYALARWLTGNSADAEDVVQDACLHAFRGIGNFSGGNARAWVLTATPPIPGSARTGPQLSSWSRTSKVSAARNPASRMSKRPRQPSSPKPTQGYSRRRSRHCRRRSARRWCCATSRASLTAKSPG
jgi:hypothetical protein